MFYSSVSFSPYTILYPFVQQITLLYFHIQNNYTKEWIVLHEG